MHITIKHKSTGAVLFDGDTADLSNADLSNANLRYADLRDADLRDADLSDADLSNADLRDANLRYANLRYADLRDANLSNANLRYANLSDANLRDANLSNANLRDANLRYANLRYADLRYANLSNATLSNADLSNASIELSQISHTRVLPDDGDVIGWKKCRDGALVKLRIPDGTPRSNATGRKCRAQSAEVIAIEGGDVASSLHDPAFSYRVGERVTVKNFDPDWRNECAPGIHFFITKQEAKDYAG